MAQWLRGITGLSGDLSLVPRINFINNDKKEESKGTER